MLPVEIDMVIVVASLAGATLHALSDESRSVLYRICTIPIATVGGYVTGVTVDAYTSMATAAFTGFLSAALIITAVEIIRLVLINTLPKAVSNWVRRVTGGGDKHDRDY